MIQTSRQYEYGYKDSSLTNAHSFLMSPLLSLLSENDKSKARKLRVLDLGCGNGSLSHVIAQQGYEVVGIDDSKQGITIASQNFPDCHFIQASIYDLPQNELKKSFDIVISVEVIEHLLYPKELVKSAKEYLKPNGRLIITTPYHGYLKNIAMAISGKMDSHFTALWDGGHVKFFSVKTLTTLLEAEGYTDINFKFAGRLPYLWKTMLCAGSLVQPET